MNQEDAIYDAAVTAAQQSMHAQQARVGFALAADTDADAYAEAQRVARRTGVPVDAVLANPHGMKLQDKVGAVDFDRLAKINPVTASALADVEKAMLMHDDVEQMGTLETLWNSTRRGWKAVQSTVPLLDALSAQKTSERNELAYQRMLKGEKPSQVLADMGIGNHLQLSDAQILAQWKRDHASHQAARQREVTDKIGRVATLQAERNAIPLPAVAKASGEKGFADFWSRFSQDPIGFLAATGPESLIQSAPGIALSVPASMLAGPTGGAAAIGANSFLTDYSSSILENLQARGVDVTNAQAINQALADPEVRKDVLKRAALHASVVGGVDAISGGVASKFVAPKVLASRLAGRPLASGLVNLAIQTPVQGALGGLGEAGGQIAAGEAGDVGQMLRKAAQGYGADALIDLKNGLHWGKISSEFAGEFFGAPSEVSSAGYASMRQYFQKQHQAEQAAQLVQGINQAAVASKVAQRSPEDFAAFAQAVAEENDSGTFYIDANVLLQTGIAEQVAQLSPAVAEQLQEAAQTGGQIAIPAGEYAAQLARSEYANQLTDHIKVEPDAWSKAEAREWMQSGEGSALQREMDYLLRDKQADATFRASSDAVRDIIKGQLSAAGRFTQQANDSYAALTSSFYAVQAAKMGMTPEELYRQHPLRVMAQTPTFEAPALVTRGAYNQLVDISQDTDRGKQRIQALAEWAQKQLEKEGFTADLQHSGSAAGPSSYLDVTDLHTGSKLDRQLRFSGHSKGAYQHQFIHDLGSEAEVLALIEELKAQRTPERIEAYQAFLARMEEKQAQQNEARAQELARLMEVETQRLQRAEEKEVKGEPLSRMDSKVLKARDEGRLLRDGGSRYWQSTEAPFRAPEVRNEQGELLAPNGEPSRLTEGQWHQVRSQHTKAAYDARIDELFAGGKANRVGARVLDRSDVLGLLGHADKPVVLQESKVIAGRDSHHRMTSEHWKKIPEWLENPVAVFKSDTESGRLVVIAPETIGGSPVSIIMEPEPTASGGTRMSAHLLVNAYDRSSNTPFMRWINDGLLQYVDKKKFPAFFAQSVGRQLPNTALQNKQGMRKILTEKNLAGYRKEQGDVLFARQQQQPNVTRGFFDPSSNTIGLLKDADLSTYLHEAGHFFLEMQVDLASRVQQEASLFGADTNTAGQAQIAKDMQILLDWFGVRDLAEWHNMDMEQKRSYHEQFARGFEAYLYEGKAPSIELQGLFRRFSSWLVRIYRELRNLNVELSDEVRGVFDRMLASSEQIALAEQGRSMMPMFDSAQEAGMTPQEFADYQALGIQATAEAIEQLRTRGLRDMKWLRNARSRELKRLQKESRAARAEMRMQASREIMQQPVYRAWQFLTSRIAEEDRIAPADAGKATVGLDESRDSLLVAVAKLGGLNRDEVTAAWGVDPKERLQAPVFGKPVLRKTNGLSIDAMGEALAERGYLRVDEHGRFDPRDLEDAFLGELRGEPHYSIAYDYSRHEMRAGDQVPNPAALAAGRIDAGELGAMGLPAEVVQTLKARRMTAGSGLHPDIVADLFGFDSGDALMRALAATEPPADAIDGLTDALMLEQHGDLATPEAIERAADDAIHNAARMRFTATEANALARAVGRRGILVSAAKEYAQTLIGRQLVRNVRPGQYAHAEARAARAADKARRAGNLELAAAEKRNQLIQQQAARAAHDARAEVDAGLRYLKRFEGDIKGLDGEYAEQIHGLLERFDLRNGQSLKAIDRRKSLAEWIAAQREAGLEPDIPPELENEAIRQSYKDMSVEDFRGLIDSVKQIEHLGKLKHRMLTAAKQRDYEAVRDEVAAGIRQHAHGRTANTRTPVTALGRALKGLKNFGAAHIKAASWARIMDGGKDGGPVWEYFIRQANVRGDMETSMRAEATAKLSAILAPVTKLGRMGGKGVWFESIGRSLNREERLAIALNTGNEGNMQRLLGGENWTLQQIMPVLQSLTSTEWQAVQAVWDHFESYRDQIAAKEKRVYGKEPQWVEPRPFTVTTADGQTLEIRGGYYPIKYDPLASMRAESHDDADAAKRQMQGAYTSATTRRSFTKSRVSEVQGRPLLYSLAGVYSGVNDVIHDLAWHEWLIDTNRLLKSHTIDAAIREHYGPEVKQQLKQWVQDIAEGDRGTNDAVEKALGRIRQSVSVAGLGFNVVSAAMQPLGLTQSVVRVGAKWVGIGISKYIAHPIDLTKRVNSMSAFMENRARTRFRELNELRNQVQQTSAAKEWMGRNAYVLMMRFQQAVDVPTWWGAYEKAIAEGNDEARAIDLADQAVIDAQGGGQTKDLSGVERGGAYQKLFTTFYSFMNTTLNLGVERTMSAHTPAQKAKLAVDYLMLFVLPAVLGELLRAGITPGDSDDFEDPEKAAKALVRAQISYLMGLLVVVREASVLADMVGDGPSFGYQGPGGLRPVADATKFAQQAKQGEFDEAFARSAINLAGSTMGLPSAQINRSVNGYNALVDGDTENPAALLFGYQEPR